MNWQPPPVTRCKYFHVRSDAASMRHTVTGGGRQPMSLIVSGTAVMRLIKTLIFILCRFDSPLLTAGSLFFNNRYPQENN